MFTLCSHEKDFALSTSKMLRIAAALSCAGALTLASTPVAAAESATASTSHGNSTYTRTISNTTPVDGDIITYTQTFSRSSGNDYIYEWENRVDSCLEYQPNSAALKVGDAGAVTLPAGNVTHTSGKTHIESTDSSGYWTYTSSTPHTFTLNYRVTSACQVDATLLSSFWYRWANIWPRERHYESSRFNGGPAATVALDERIRTSVALIDTPQQATVNTPISLRARVSATASQGVQVPSLVGQRVRFVAADRTVCSADVAADGTTASCDWTPTEAGNYQIKAVVEGQGLILASESRTASIAVAAAPPVDNNTPVAPPGIDVNRNGSITIHKRDITGATAGEAGTGLPDDNAPGTALSGVTFELQQVDIDLKDARNWANIPTSAADARALGFTGVPRTGTTGDDGQVRFGDLPIGVYLVTETQVPTGVVPGAPFLVSIPMLNPDGSTWNYDPVVYPKNTVVTATKSVTDADQQLGQEITYSVSAPVPTLQPGQSVRRFIVRDDYDESKLSLPQPLSSHVRVSIGNNDVDPSAYTVADNNGVLSVEFTDFAALNAPENRGATVTVNFNAPVTGIGRIRNQANVIVNNPSNEDEIEEITTPTNPVDSYYGRLELVKTGTEDPQANPATPLQGAVFQLYRANQQAQCLAEELDEEQEQDARRVSVGGVTEWTTDNAGRITIEGLHVTSYENNIPVEGQNAYCLLEVAAPAGYTTPTGADALTEFTLHHITDNQGSAPEAPVIVKNVTVTNLKQSTPNLPMTGGSGIAVMAAIAAAILAAGAWFARRSSTQA